MDQEEEEEAEQEVETNKQEEAEAEEEPAPEQEEEESVEAGEEPEREAADGEAAEDSGILSDKERQNEEVNEKDNCSASSISSASSTLEREERLAGNNNETGERPRALIWPIPPCGCDRSPANIVMCTFLIQVLHITSLSNRQMSLNHSHYTKISKR